MKGLLTCPGRLGLICNQIFIFKHLAMRPQRNGNYLIKEVQEFNDDIWRSPDHLEDLFNAMSIEEIKKSKPKSRLESFLRKKALEKKKQYSHRKK